MQDTIKRVCVKANLRNNRRIFFFIWCLYRYDFWDAMTGEFGLRRAHKIHLNKKSQALASFNRRVHQRPQKPAT
jgi:hypothetical protein